MSMDGSSIAVVKIDIFIAIHICHPTAMPVIEKEGVRIEKGSTPSIPSRHKL
jgi:hypothetical protein